mgnify:CR=1 FL=1
MENGRKNGEEYFSYYERTLPDCFLGWQWGFHNGVARFGLGAEISPVLWTVGNNLIEKVIVRAVHSPERRVCGDK